ncbi:MAG: ribonuclease BN, partial [Halobaculum sp.]
MTSLAEVYEGKVGEEADRRRLYLGVGTFLVGSLLAAAGIVVVGTQSGDATIESIRNARWLAGVLAGVGVPAVFLGVFAVLPAGRVTRAAAVVGAGVSLLGVSLFAHAYPCHWAGAPCASTDLTLPTLGVYFFGVVTTFWCLFVGVANFKSRNDPGGTVELEVTRGGETKTIEVSRSKLDANEESPSGGGIGFFGETPDGNVETQTNHSPKARVADDAITDGAAGSGLSDGGATREQ